MSRILSTFKNYVELTLKAAKQRKAEISAKKSSDLGSTIQRYEKLLNGLKDDAERMEKELQDLKKVFVKAAKASVKKKLEDAISVFKESRQKWASMGSLYIQIQDELGDNPVASKFLKQAKKLEKEFKKIHEEKEKLLSDLTKNLVPVQLTTNDNDFFRPLIAYLVEEVHKLGKDADIKVKKSKYIPGIGPNGEIRWARFIPLVNIPSMSGEEKNIYLVVCITFLAYSEAKGKIIPMMITDKRGVEKPAISQYSIGMLNKYVDPIELSKVLYKVSSLNDAKDTIAYLAEKNNLFAFGRGLEGTHQQRMDKVAEKLKVLNQKGIKVVKDKQNRNFITVKIPKDLVDTNAMSDGRFKLNHNPTEWDKQLYMDVQTYAGLPKNSRYNYGRLRLEKVSSKGDTVNFLYRILPVTIDKLKTDDLMNKNGSVPILDQDTDLDKNDWGALRRVADQWLHM